MVTFPMCIFIPKQYTNSYSELPIHLLFIWWSAWSCKVSIVIPLFYWAVRALSILKMKKTENFELSIE